MSHPGASIAQHQRDKYERAAQAFIEEDTGTGFARLDRYRASLERTYHRCARELRATRKEQNEPNSQQLAEKKFEKLLKRMLDGPPPGYEFQPKLVRVEEKGQQMATNGTNNAVSDTGAGRGDGS